MARIATVTDTPYDRRALAMGAVGVACAGTALVLSAAIGEFEAVVVGIALTALSWLLPGTLVAARRPRLPFGWLLLAGGLFLASSSVTLGYGTVGLARGWTLAVWVAWVGGWIAFPHLGCMEAAYLLFPTGRLPSPRWRRVVTAIVVVNVTMALAGAFAPGPIGFTRVLSDVPNPAPTWEPLGAVFGMSALGQNVLNLLAMAVVFCRWRRAQDPERRSLAVVLALGVLNAVVGVLLVAPVGDWVLVLAVPSTMALTGAISWAVLRHQLWDIRVIVSRTLTWLVLTGLILALLAGCVALVGIAVTGTAGRNVGLLAAAAITTALVAPAERRLRRSIDRLLFGDRLEPYTVLSSLGTELEVAGSPTEGLDRLVAGIRSSLRVSYAAVELVGRDGAHDVVASSGDAPDAVIALPVVHHGRHMGSLIVGQRPGDRPFTDADRRLLGDLARQAGGAAAAVALATALQVSRQRIVTAREEERRRLRHELHDGVASALTAIGLKVDSAAALAAGDDPRAQTVLASVQADVTATLHEVRRVVTDLRPPALDDLGLRGALAQLASRFDSPTLRVVFAPGGLDGLVVPAAVELAVYRIATEALQNVARHAAAKNCRVELRTEGGRLLLTVEDDGRGFPDTNGSQTGLGVPGMRERAEELGGMLSIAGRADGRPGASITASLPVEGLR
jgi:two-component system, NarL family, sensor kinase